MTGKFCALSACYAATLSVVIGSLAWAETPASISVDPNSFRYTTCIGYLPHYENVGGGCCGGVPTVLQGGGPMLQLAGAQQIAAQRQAEQHNAAAKVATGDHRDVQGPRLNCFSTIPRVNTFNYTATPVKAKPDVKAPSPMNLMLAAKEGKVEAKVVARDANHVRVFLKNSGKMPLTVKLPEVLAARPVLAQQNFFNPGGGQGFNFTGQGNNNRGGGQSQAIAGPTTFGQSQNGNQGNNIFAIPPESVREIRVQTVCLEHGKPEPKSSVKYELVDFVSVGGTPELETVLVRYGRGDLDPEAVQAAAWHLANGKSWHELAQMSRMSALNARAPIFTTQQLRAARQLTEGAEKFVAQETAAKRRAAAQSPIVSKEPPKSPADEFLVGSTKDRLFSPVNARK